jgi:hypothetical protein
MYSYAQPLHGKQQLTVVFQFLGDNSPVKVHSYVTSVMSQLQIATMSSVYRCNYMQKDDKRDDQRNNYEASIPSPRLPDWRSIIFVLD